MPRTIRKIAGLVTFAAIQAVSIVVLSRRLTANAVPEDHDLFNALTIHFGVILASAGIAAWLWRDPAKPFRPSPPLPPETLSPVGKPTGPRRPSPLVAHAVSDGVREVRGLGR